MSQTLPHMREKLGATADQGKASGEQTILQRPGAKDSGNPLNGERVHPAVVETGRLTPQNILNIRMLNTGSDCYMNAVYSVTSGFMALCAGLCPIITCLTRFGTCLWPMQMLDVTVCERDRYASCF